MPAPLVSVIIPAYNAASHLEAAVSSALAQTYQRLEVVIAVDGATDATMQMASGFAREDSRVRVVAQQRGGVASARNLAVASSKGELIAPLDADDHWSPDKITAQVERMQRGGPEMGLVYSWWVGSDEEGNLKLPLTRPPILEGCVLDALVLSNFIGNASVPLYRRSALDAVGPYDPSLRDRGGQGCEDWDLALRVAERYQVGLVPQFHVAYRDVGTGMSKDVAQMERSYDLVIEGVLDRTPTISDRILRWSKANFLQYLAGVASTSSPRASLRYMARSVALDPVALLARSLWRRSLGDGRSLLGEREEEEKGVLVETWADLDAAAPTRSGWAKPYRQIGRRRMARALAAARVRRGRMQT